MVSVFERVAPESRCPRYYAARALCPLSLKEGPSGLLRRRKRLGHSEAERTPKERMALRSASR